MIAPPGSVHSAVQTLWQSPDGLMAAGEAQLSQWRYGFASLGPRLLTHEDIQGLVEAVKAIPVEKPLLLLSNCPGFALSPEEEAEGMVFTAGAYRALQQERKASGGLILSYIEQIAVGGVYLMHGLSAQYRAVEENTVFYDTVPSRPPVPLAKAQAKGLLDEILPAEKLESWLTKRLADAFS